MNKLDYTLWLVEQLAITMLCNATATTVDKLEQIRDIAKSLRGPTPYEKEQKDLGI